ncbi:MAG: hypothetical protein KC940_01620, partial [Candidatus Omnitrophica bacterium]|nr:hypothetical protein [Candidatus Omnitrophota bacterium]
MQIRSDIGCRSTLGVTCVALILFFHGDLGFGYTSSGPGTTGSHIPQKVTIWDYDWSQPSDPLYPTAMAPGVRDALGGCVESEGNLPNSPIVYDMQVVTDEDA